MARFLLLLAAVACVSALLVAAAPQVSPKTKAIIQADAHYHRLLAKTRDVNSTLGEAFSTSYQYSVASKLMWHSVSAYCADDPALTAWTCNSCKQFGAFHVTQIMDDTVNQGYVGYFTQGLPASPISGVSASSPFVLVSFRGTVPSDLSDWIEDLSASKFAAFSDSYPDVSVHEGFWGAYQSLKPGMMDGISAALSASGATTILLTGHSLGGAMAECAAIDLKLNEYPSYKYASYTQGTPRVGNQAFADLYLQQVDASFREIHYHDIVPHLPPELLGFRHAPTELWFNEDFSSYTTCSSSDGEDSNCSDSVLAPISIPDHLTYRGVDLGGYCSTGSKKTVAQPVAAAVAPAPVATALQQLQKEYQERKLKEEAAQKAKQAAKPKKSKIILSEN